VLQKARTYLSLVLLLLVIFPTAEKSLHGLEHEHEESCNSNDLHFCEVEFHSCSICDFVFSASCPPIKASLHFTISTTNFHEVIPPVLPGKINTPGFTFSLRGPPAC
jgi:hypothetical protein